MDNSAIQAPDFSGKANGLDKISREKRSENMSKIKGKNTKIELSVRKYLFSRGLRYHINDKKLPGKPDIVLKKWKTAIFVHGCFWHCHENCKNFRLPKSNTEFWAEKLSKNKERDFKVYEELVQSGWNVIIVWECELEQSPQETLEKLYGEITKTKNR